MSQKARGFATGKQYMVLERLARDKALAYFAHLQDIKKFCVTFAPGKTKFKIKSQNNKSYISAKCLFSIKTPQLPLNKRYYSYTTENLSRAVMH
jgi:hypothetical protein